MTVIYTILNFCHLLKLEKMPGFNMNLSTKNEGIRIILDLGTEKEIAEVTVNRQKIGTLWKSPYQVDITNAVKTGKSQRSRFWKNVEKGIPEIDCTETNSCYFFSKSANKIPFRINNPLFIRAKFV